MADPLGIEGWVDDALSQREPVRSRDSKAVHDPLLGTNLFRPEEVALIDTVLLQRLRSIAQTGLVYLTYPAARHSRFEHTLGCVTLVDRYVDALRLRGVEITL